MPDSAGLLKAKIEKRLEAMAQAPPSSPGPTGAVDLLRIVDVGKDGVVGDWTCDGKRLSCVKRLANARIQIPYQPPDEYDLTIVVERKEGSDALGIGLAKGSLQWIIAVDGWGASASGISTVDGKWGLENETTVRGKLLATGKPYTLVCSVRKESVTMTVDGKKVLEYKGRLDRLGNLPTLAVPGATSLFIVSYESLYTINKYALIPVTGQGKMLR